MGTTGTPLDGRYRLGDLLGTGGMADVYRAVDVRLSRSVAVKLFHPKADGATIAHRRIGVSGPALQTQIILDDASPLAPGPYLITLDDGKGIRRTLKGWHRN